MNVRNALWATGVVLLMGCHTANQSVMASNTTDPENPLVGKILHVATGEFVDEEALISDMLDEEYILLGETHDNPAHHRYQAWVIDQLRARGQQRSVAFEMLTPEQEAALTNRTLQSADDVFDAVQWEETGWPKRDMYEPVFTAALNAGFPIHAANVDRKELNDIMTKGKEDLPEKIKAQLEKNPLSEQEEELLRSGIVESHCQMLPEQMVPAMMLGQRVRDAVIADNVTSHKGRDGTVLIAGSGHTQKNGVPGFIRSADPSARILAMAWMEVDPHLTEAQQYSEYFGGEVLPFDYVWFTARVDRADPCEELKKHHKFSEKKS